MRKASPPKREIPVKVSIFTKTSNYVYDDIVHTYYGEKFYSIRTSKGVVNKHNINYILKIQEEYEKL